MLTLYYLGEKLIGSVSGRQAAEKLSEGVKINRRRHNYPGRPQVGKKFAKKNFTVSITVAQCRKYPIPYLYTLSQTISYLYTLNRAIPYLYILNRTIPYLNTLSRTIPYLNTLSRIIPYVNTLSRTIPYLNTLSRTLPYLNTLSRTIPYVNTLGKNPILAQNQILVGSQSQSSTKKTLKPRQPIKIEYHSAEKKPKSSRLGWRTLLGSRLLPNRVGSL